ncbi:MAG: hypothetical protein MUC38_09430 [Cyclobacteriaceae bacterium]|jgi:hypothetical protein|nr:hypothetical protein [Cyclobacteriaceae bacterium]
MVRLKLIGLVLFWSVALYSCKEVSFPQTQPAGVAALAEVPAGLRGHYNAVDNVTREKGDTLIIESWGYRFTDKNDKDWLGRGVLSDSLVVKFYENVYFVNFKADNQWVLRLIRKKSTGDLEFLYLDIQSDEKRQELLKRLGKRLAIKEIKRQDDTFYQINPTPQQLMALINEGFFTAQRLEKMETRLPR